MYGSAREKMGKGRKKESRMQQALPPMEQVPVTVTARWILQVGKDVYTGDINKKYDDF